MHTVDITESNIEKIGQLFPNCLTERIGEDGKMEKVIDFDQLRQELSKEIVEGPQERYQFTWPDKKKAIRLANTPSSMTLRPCREESVDFDNTKNLYIEGDNLEVLKLLREDYLGKVKMIYIDPPYNTGTDFIYNDDFSHDTSDYSLFSGQIDDEGNRLVQNTESNGRFHSDWLNMMYPRLKIARDILSDDGVLFISIDDNEVFNLKKICDELFGANNFVVQFAVQLNPRGRNLDLYVAKTHESVLVYVKNYLNTACLSGVEKEGKMVEEYDKEDERGKYRAIGLRNRNQSFNPITRPNLYYPLYVNPKDGSVSVNETEEHTIKVFPDAPDGTKTCWTWMKAKVEKESRLIIAENTSGGWRIFRKDYLLSDDGTIATTLVKSLWADNTINNDYGKKAIKDLFGANIMSFPKSPDLIKKLLLIGSHKDSLIVDFFSGSATTAHAVLDLNREDCGTRKYIMVQIPEILEEKTEAYKAGYKNICEIGKERIRRAGKKILEEQEKAESNGGLFAQTKSMPKLDIGFRVLKLDSSNMNDVYYRPEEFSDQLIKEDNVKEDRTPEDLLFQVMLECNLPLSAKIQTEKIAGKEVYSVNNGYLVACFDEDVNEQVIKDVAKRKPYYFVMRDSSLESDNVADNFEQIFQAYSKETIRRIL